MTLRHLVRLTGSDHAAVEAFLEQLPDEPWYNAARERFGEFALKLVLYEALVNAVTHGNRGAAQPEITVAVALDADAVALTVSDAGTGYDPVIRESILAAAPPDGSGRGLRLIRHYVDRVEFNPAGNSITMRKDAPRAAGAGETSGSGRPRSANPAEEA